MKIKLLLAPSLIIGIIILLIWFVYPGYTNGGDSLKPAGIKEKRAELQMEKEKLARIVEKNNNIKKLSDQLINSGHEQEVLMEFIPVTVAEEEIVDKLNFNASSLGISVFNLSVAQPKAAPAAPVIESSEPESASAKIVPLPKEENVAVSFSVIGGYDKIKELLEKIYRLKRFNEVISLEVGAQKEATNGNASSAPADNLQVDMVLGFNTLKEVEKIGDPEGKVFSMQKFDMGTIAKIEEMKNIDVPEPLRVGESGRANPFRP
jgi:hypothetical protein